MILLKQYFHDKTMTNKTIPWSSALEEEEIFIQQEIFNIDNVSFEHKLYLMFAFGASRNIYFFRDIFTKWFQTDFVEEEARSRRHQIISMLCFPNEVLNSDDTKSFPHFHFNDWYADGKPLQKGRIYVKQVSAIFYHI